MHTCVLLALSYVKIETIVNGSNGNFQHEPTLGTRQVQAFQIIIVCVIQRGNYASAIGGDCFEITYFQMFMALRIGDVS